MTEEDRAKRDDTLDDDLSAIAACGNAIDTMPSPVPDDLKAVIIRRRRNNGKLEWGLMLVTPAWTMSLGRTVLELMQTAQRQWAEAWLFGDQVFSHSQRKPVLVCWSKRFDALVLATEDGLFAREGRAGDEGATAILDALDTVRPPGPPRRVYRTTLNREGHHRLPQVPVDAVNRFLFTE